LWLCRQGHLPRPNVRFGSKAVSLRPSKCFPVCASKQTQGVPTESEEDPQTPICRWSCVWKWDAHVWRRGVERRRGVVTKKRLKAFAAHSARPGSGMSPKTTQREARRTQWLMLSLAPRDRKQSFALLRYSISVSLWCLRDRVGHPGMTTSLVVCRALQYDSDYHRLYIILHREHLKPHPVRSGGQTKRTPRHRDALR